MKKIITLLSLLFATQSVFAIETWELEAGTEIPFQIAGRVKANFNSEFYATTGLGMSLDFLMGINSSLISGVGILGENTAEVVTSAISNSFIIDIRGGWNLHNLNGLFVEAGYLYMMGGGGDVTVDQLENAFGTEYSANPLVLSNASLMSIGTDLHALTVHAGYRWQIAENWLFNVDVGLIKPFTSTTTLNADQVVGGSQAVLVAQQLKDHVESEISDVYLSQLFIPTATVWLSWLF
ncbi:MAG: hypothetical protein H6625_02980 [Bdellovibrionaceae bacterium]|nr:hypothetical protein [Pseudobdellovibrionaceae bacterium]